MKALKKMAEDIRDMGNMLIALADDLDRAASIDISGLALLLGGVVQQSAEPVQKRPQIPKEHTGQDHPTRHLTRQEKDQLRLLWNQSSRNRSTDLPRLAETYKVSLKQLSAVLFNQTQNAVKATLAKHSETSPPKTSLSDS